MTRLRDLSIRQKLTRVAMMSSSLALVFAAIGLDRINF